MKKLLLSLSGIFAAVPGLAIISTGLGAPPGYKLLFGGVIEALGTLALLVVALNRSKLERRSIKHVTRITIAFGALFAVCMGAYLILFNQCMVECGKSDKVFFPIWLNGALREEVKMRGGSRRQALCDLQDWVRREIDRSHVATNASAVILLLLYATTSTSLVLAFACPGLYVKQPDSLLGDAQPDGKKTKKAKKPNKRENA